MLPETKQEDVTTETSTTVTEQAKSAEKKFTDADMTGLRKSKDAELTKAKQAWEDEKKSLLSAHEETLGKANAMLQKHADLLKKDMKLDAITLRLLNEKDAAGQLELLEEIVEEQSKQTEYPKTPVPNKKPEKVTFQRKNQV